MYLSKITIGMYKTDDTDIKAEFYEALRNNKINIRYSVNLQAHYITYFFSDNYFGACSFIVDSDGYVYRRLNSLKFQSFELDNAFIEYMYELEKTYNDDTLKALYPDIYDEEIIKRNMTEKEKAEYDYTKNNFIELLSSIKDSEEYNEASDEPEKLLFNISIEDYDEEDEDTFSYSIYVLSVNKKIKYYFDRAYEHFILNGYPVEKESKDVLLAFSSLYEKKSYYYDHRKEDIKFNKMVIGQGIKVLINQKSDKALLKAISLKNVDYDLDKEIKYIEVTIDKDGNINSPYVKNSHSFFFDFNIPKELVYFDAKKHLATYIILNSDVEKKLLLFKSQNPLFDTKLFKKEITQSLIPAIKNNVNIESNLLHETMKKIDHIDYYIDLNKEKLELICKSIYFLDGNEVSQDEYKIKHELDLYSFLLELSNLDMLENGIIDNDEIIANFVSTPLSKLKRTCQVFISDDVKKLKKQPVSKINIVIESNQDWFSLHFESNEYNEDEINSILSAYKKKKKYYRLKNEILVLDEGKGKDIISLMNDFDLKQEKIPIYQALKLKARQDITLSSEIKDLFKKIQNYEKQKISLNKNLSKILRPYQKNGVKWLTALKENHLSGILADDMGLGKSLEIIAFLSQYHENKPNLIICPKSLTYNWENEFNQWNPKEKVIVLSTNKDDRHKKIDKIKDNTTYIISYDSLRNDLEYFNNKKFGFLILDESQYIANALAKKSRAVKSLNADYKFALTGTPIQNSLMDLWSIFDFLMPGYLKTFNEFKKLYGKFDLDKNDRKHLENIVSPFLLKRKKDDVLKELPGKTIMTQSLVMDNEEQVLYDAYLSKARNALYSKENKDKNNKFEILSALTRLRQLCVDPSTFLEYKNVSTKLEYTLSLIKEAINNGHKILLFSSFTSVLNHLSALLDEENIIHEKIQGETPAIKRIQISNDFNEKDNIKVMLISLKAGGTGLNLIGADIVIHLDPWWNLAAEDQASDRAYRIGQTRKVIIYKLVMKNTIEEKVLTLQGKKKDLSDIFDNINSSSGLTDEDIKYLLN